MNYQITKDEVLTIREENKKLIEERPNLTDSERYDIISSKTSRSEWSVRWICQGREHLEDGGFIEEFDHEGDCTRAIDNQYITSIRERAVNQGISAYSLAEEYGVSIMTIKRILLGKTYRDIDGPTISESEFNSKFVKPIGWKVKTAKQRLLKEKPPERFRMLVAKTEQEPVKEDTRPLTDEESRLNGMDIFYIRSGFNNMTIQELQDKFNLPRQSIVDILSGNIFAARGGRTYDIEENEE